MEVKDLGAFPVVFITGPGAVNEGFMSFMRSDAYDFNTPAGRYIGVGNRSVTIVGNKTNQDMYITRVIAPVMNDTEKHRLYQETNMTHLTRIEGTPYKPKKVDESCMSRLYSLASQNYELMSKSLNSNSHMTTYY